MAKDKFQKLDGIMVGRAAYDLPLNYLMWIVFFIIPQKQITH